MKYMQFNDDGYTPCGKWRVVPTEPTDTEIHAAYRNALGQSIRERDIPEIRKFSNALVKSAPTPPAEMMLSGEPVGYAHEIRKVDFIHKDVRELLDKFYAEHGFHSQTDRPPIKTTEHYTVPVYLHPTPDAATVRDADRLAWLLADYGNRSAQVFREWDGESDLRAVIDAARGAK